MFKFSLLLATAVLSMNTAYGKSSAEPGKSAYRKVCISGIRQPLGVSTRICDCAILMHMETTEISDTQFKKLSVPPITQTKEQAKKTSWDAKTLELDALYEEDIKVLNKCIKVEADRVAPPTED